MADSTQWKYSLNKRGRVYVIFLMEHEGDISTGTPVFRSYEYEEAPKELYRLNGWKYQPKKK